MTSVNSVFSSLVLSVLFYADYPSRPEQDTLKYFSSVPVSEINY